MSMKNNPISYHHDWKIYNNQLDFSLSLFLIINIINLLKFKDFKHLDAIV